MKSVFTILLSLCTILTLYSQHKVWQFDFSAEDVYVRTDTSHVMYKANIDIPSNGHIVARIEGECRSTVGDIITLGVNDWNDWLTNYGNVGAIIFDIGANKNSFTHMMVFSVEQGQKDFYALAQNWTDRDGSGSLSYAGRMILEFIPDDEGKKRTFFKNTIHSTNISNPQDFALDTLEIDMAESGSVLLTNIGSIYASQGDEITLSIKSVNTNRQLSADQSIFIPHWDKGFIFNMNDTLRLPAGKHSFYIHGARTASIEDKLGIGLYSVFSAIIQYDSDLQTEIRLNEFSTEINEINNSYNFANVSYEVPSRGTLLVMYSGETDLISGQSLTVNANVSMEEIVEELSTTTWSTHVDDQKSFFYRSQMMKVGEGTIEIDMNAEMNGNVYVLSSQVVKGKLIIKFIADPIASDVSDVSIDSEIWKVYPNPTSGELTISSTVTKNTTDIAIFDTNGKVINYSRSKDQRVNIHDSPAGIYFMMIKSDTTTTLHKIIKVD